MNRQVVTSGNLASFGFERYAAGDAFGVLEVEFQGGRVYRYEGVSARLADELQAAPSKGAFFAATIRPNFVGVRVDVAAPVVPESPEVTK